MTAYPAAFDITQPERFNRMHIVIRIPDLDHPSPSSVGGDRLGYTGSSG